MPDITMCQKDRNTCKKKNKCVRYLAHPSYMQSYSKFFVKNDCKYFWKDETKGHLKRNLKD